MIIPAEIYAETMNVLGRKGGHEFAVTSMDNLLISSLILVVESNNEIRFNAVTLFEKSPASVSYTDCLVMAFADHFETKIIFGFDGAFAKNDYKLPAWKKSLSTPTSIPFKAHLYKPKYSSLK